MIRLYTASKLVEHETWRQFERDNPHVFCHARWLRHQEIGTPDDAERAARFWVEDVEDVQTADAVAVLARVGEHLRGALVEAGVAIACGKPLFVVGDHPDYGTWQHHPGVTRVPGLVTLACALVDLEDHLRRAKWTI